MIRDGRRVPEDSIATSKVVRDLSPQQVFAQNVRHHRTQVPPLFRQQRTALENTWHSGECEEAPDPPKLLQRAEALLRRKLEAAASNSAMYGQLRSRWAESTLRLDAHRCVFDVLVNSMTTYKPILAEIKQAYDDALDEALKSAYENNMIRAKLAEAAAKQSEAVDAALADCAQNALQLKQQLLQQLADTEAAALAADQEAVAAETAAKDAQLQLQNVHRRAQELKLENQKLQAHLQAHSTWAKRT